METNIRKEYERLKELARTSQGLTEIDDAWMEASNYEKRGDDWYKRGDSAGDFVSGIAIDSQPPHSSLVYNKGYDHQAAYFELVRAICDKENPDSSEEHDKILHRIKRGWAAHTDKWKFPLITFNEIMWQSEEFIAMLEEATLAQEIGLPLFAIHVKQIRQESAERKQKLKRK